MYLFMFNRFSYHIRRVYSLANSGNPAIGSPVFDKNSSVACNYKT